MNSNRNYWWRTIASFLLVLFSMPLGHALMILMERLMSPSAMHYAGFLMGLAGLFLVIVGVFAKGDTRQTLWGLFGGLLFWTGMGGISLPLLCPSLRRTARNRERCHSNKTRISHYARIIRNVDDGNDDVRIQHEKWLRLYYLDTKSMFPK